MYKWVARSFIPEYALLSRPVRPSHKVSCAVAHTFNQEPLQKTDQDRTLGNRGSLNPPVQGWHGNSEITGYIAR
jgi:hypothetical protein